MRKNQPNKTLSKISNKLGFFKRKAFNWATKALTAEDFAFFFTQAGRTAGPFNELRDKELQDFYSRQAIVYSCIRLITTSALQAPPVIGMQTEDGFEIDDQHPMNAVLKNPNPEMSYAEFLMYHVIHLLTTGSSYIWEWRNGAGEISELWPLPSSWVKPIPLASIQEGDDRRIISHFEVTPDTTSSFKNETIVMPKDMTYTRFPHPDNFIESIGPLEAATRSLQMDEEKENFIKELLENTPFPGLVLTQEEAPSPEQQQALREKLTDRVGKTKRGNALFLYGAGAGVEVPTPLADLDWHGMSNLNEANINAAFGVPPILSGARVGLENSPWSNVGEAKKIFFETTMTAFWLFNQAAWTRGFLKSEDDDIHEIKHDLAGVESLQANATEKAERATTLWKSGLITRDEAREMAGLDPSDSATRGDVFVVPSTVIESPRTATLIGIEETIPPNDPKKHLQGSDVSVEELLKQTKNKNGNGKRKHNIKRICTSYPK